MSIIFLARRGVLVWKCPFSEPHLAVLNVELALRQFWTWHNERSDRRQVDISETQQNLNRVADLMDAKFNGFAMS